MSVENITTILLDFFTRSPMEVVFDLFAIFGWTIFSFLLLFVALEFYVDYRQDKYKADWKWVLLAIDIPPTNLQTPKAVEQMFAHIAGAYNDINIADKYYRGEKQRHFSFEIISIEGYIQFLIRTEEKFRELIETAIYAQYSDAEIVEVEDYVRDIPDNFPNDTHDIWASDFGLSQDDAYPIRSYREFEHNISKDTVLKDPVGTFLESFSRIGAGEQMWFQIIIEPTTNSWKEKAIKKIKQIIGEKEKKKVGVSDHVSKAFYNSLETFGDQIFGREPSSGSEEKSDGEKNELKFLTPGQVKIVEAMEEKISKIGFKTKIRAVYLARKEVFRPSRGIHALVGAINQYNIQTANAIIPTYKSKASYLFKKYREKYRKELLMKAYKKRKSGIGANPFILNIEELATIWHFPMSHVKTPLLQKAEGKRVEPPSSLPAEVLPDIPVGNVPPGGESGESSTSDEKTYQTDSGEAIQYGDQRFG